MIIEGVLENQMKLIKSIGVAVIVAVLLVSGVCFYFYHSAMKEKINNLEDKVNILSANNSILTSNNATLKSNLDTTLQTNSNNLSTIDKLLAERKSTIDTIERLAKAEEQSTKKAKELQDAINKSKGDPSKDAPLAPVLYDTLKNL